MAYRLDCRRRVGRLRLGHGAVLRHPVRGRVHRAAAVAGRQLPAKDRQKLAAMREGVVRLCEGADLVIYDTQFTPEEYQRIPHCGHSRPDDAIEICARGGRDAPGAVPPRARAHRRRDRRDPRRHARRRGRRRARAGRRRRLRGPGGGAGAALMELTLLGRARLDPGAGAGDEALRRQHLVRRRVRTGGGGAHHPRLRHRRAQPRASALMDGAFGKGAGEASILLSHAHWDHIQGFPFFAPVFSRATASTSIGGAESSSMLEGILEGQMAPAVLPAADAEEHGRAASTSSPIAEGKPFEVERLPGARAHEPARPRGRARVPHRGGRRARSCTRATPATRAGGPPAEAHRALPRRGRADPRQHLHARGSGGATRDRGFSSVEDAVSAAIARAGQAPGAVPLRPGLQRRRGRRAVRARPPAARRARRRATSSSPARSKARRSASERRRSRPPGARES